MSLISVSSGLIYRAMGMCNMLALMMVLTSRYIGFPLDFFPVLFAVPRVVGWLAHWRQVRLEHARDGHL
jgi:citrate synthase